VPTFTDSNTIGAKLQKGYVTLTTPTRGIVIPRLALDIFYLQTGEVLASAILEI